MREPADISICFLTYVSRSGSTFLSSRLDAHPELLATIEADFPTSLLGLGPGEVLLGSRGELARYLRRLGDDDKFPRWNVDVRAAAALAEERLGWPLRAADLFPLILSLHAADQGMTRGVVLFKGRLPTPVHFETVAQRYPGCRMLHVVRDPRAVWLSQKGARNPRDGMPLGWSPQRCAAQWAEQVGAALRASDDPRFRLLRYEELVRDPKTQVDAVCAWLGLDPADLVAGDDGGYRERIPGDQRHLHALVGGAADPGRIDRWRELLPDEEVRAVEAAAGPLLERMGYDPVRAGTAGDPTPRLRRLDRARVLEYRLKRLLRLCVRPGRLMREIGARRKGW